MIGSYIRTIFKISCSGTWERHRYPPTVLSSQKRAIHKNHFHLFIFANRSSPFRIVTATRYFSFSVFKQPHNCVFHLFSAIIGRKETGDPFVTEFDRLFLIGFRLCHNILNGIRRQLSLAVKSSESYCLRVGRRGFVSSKISTTLSCKL